MEEVMLLYASNKRLEGWVSLDVGGPVELLKWRSASTLEAAPMWVSPTQTGSGKSPTNEKRQWLLSMPSKLSYIQLNAFCIFLE
jgi:hypothetical protein